MIFVVNIGNIDMYANEFCFQSRPHRGDSRSLGLYLAFGGSQDTANANIAGRFVSLEPVGYIGGDEDSGGVIGSSLGRD